MTRLGSILKNRFFGLPRDLSDKSVFQRISLVAFFAWVGLGSDPLSSSCYGPEEMMRNLGGHSSLAIFAAALSVLTILTISASYRQIIRLFPHGGGGYIVATKLISPSAGMLSGSALLIDYVLTITISISSGADAIFSFLPVEWAEFKLPFAVLILSLLILLNLRGVRESVLVLTPIFLLFVVSHLVLIGFGIFPHLSDTGRVVSETSTELQRTASQLGSLGALILILKAYSMGAGTYTGIEAVSNGIPNLREPKAHTAQKTMMLLSFSLALAVFGLMISYYLVGVDFLEGKTLNAALSEAVTSSWNPITGKGFVFLILVSEAALLFVAAQTGFLDGPRVMANMAADQWLPRRFMHLSDRLVSRNGILIMGGAAFVLLLVSRGRVSWLVILYSINVFITFCLSQFGMVRHWIQVRKEERHWLRKLLVNGIGLTMTTFILLTVIILKFKEGGWITLLITGFVCTFAVLIKIHYNYIRGELLRARKAFNSIMPDLVRQLKRKALPASARLDPRESGKAVVFLVNGYNGLGLYTLFKVIESLEPIGSEIVFLQVGIVDSKSLQGYSYVERLKETIETDLRKYQYIARQVGWEAEYRYALGTDVVEEVEKMVPEIMAKYPDAIFIGGQLVFNGNSGWSKLLHNYTIFAIQRKLYQHGLTTIIVPIRLEDMLHVSDNGRSIPEKLKRNGIPD